MNLVRIFFGLVLFCAGVSLHGQSNQCPPVGNPPNDGGCYAWNSSTCQFENAEDITFEPPEMCSGRSTVLAADSVFTPLTYASGDSNIIAISGDEATGGVPGETTITVTNSKGCTKTVTVVVTDNCCDNGGSISAEGASIAIGEQYTINPSGGSGDYTYGISSDSSVVTLSGNQVTGVAVGTQIVTIDDAHQTCGTTITITVGSTGVSGTGGNLCIGEDTNINAAGGSGSYLYDVAEDDEDIITVDASGNVHAKKEGTAVVTVSDSADSTNTTTVEFNVLMVNIENQTVTLGVETTLTVSSGEGSASDFVSSDSSIVEVLDATAGTVMAHMVGTATITASAGTCEDTAIITVQSANGESLSLSVEESAGMKGRKIALNGAMLPDEKPQSEAETDQPREETYIDAMSLNLRHDTTDVYVPIPSSDLAMSVHRSVVSESWNLRSGLSPSERPDRPFGAAWSTNLAANIHFTVSRYGRDYYASPDTAVVTDEAGVQYTFAIQYGDDVYWDDTIEEYVGTIRYVPLPSNRHDQGAFQYSLALESGNYVFRKKYGGKLIYGPSGLEKKEIYVDRIDEFGSQYHAYAKLVRAEDRYGNTLDYAYNEAGVVPSTISDQWGRQMIIAKNFNGLIDYVQDFRGKKVSYAYENGVVVGALDEDTSYKEAWVELRGVAFDGSAVTQYSYNQETDSDKSRDRKGEPVFHVDVSGIIDPQGNAYGFMYRFDHSRGIWKDGGNYIKTGLPRLVSTVQRPSGPNVYFSNEGSYVRLEISEAGVVTCQGKRKSSVLDANGNSRVYEFGAAQVQTLSNFQETYPSAGEDEVQFDAPRIAFYTNTTISYYAGNHNAGGSNLGNESYKFSPAAGMAPVSVKDYSGNSTIYEYADEFRSTLPFDYYMSVTAYGAFSDPTKQVNALQKEKTFTYGEKRIMTSVRDEAGTVTRYRLDSEARPSGVPDDHHSSLALGNKLGRRISETVTSGTGVVMSHTTYDFPDTYFPGESAPDDLSLNFVTRQIVHKLSSDSGEPSWVADRVTEYVPDSYGRLWKEIVDPEGLALTTVYTYDANGNKLTVRDPRGKVTRFDYDVRNRLKRVTYPGDAFKEFFYDSRGNKISEIDENGVATFWIYDKFNRVVHQVLDLNENGVIDYLADGTTPDRDKDIVTSYTYDELNARTSVRDPRGTVTRFIYDALQRLESKIEAEGQLNYVTRYDYGPNSGGRLFDGSSFKPTQITDPRGYKTKVIYDRLYRPVTETVEYRYGTYATTQKTYDNVGNLLTVTDPLGKITKTTYDALRRPLSVTDAYGTGLAATTATAYTSTGFAWKVTDPMGRITTTEYDAAGRAVKVYAPAVDDALTPETTLVKPMTETVYDAAGNVSAVIDPRGRRTDFTYDARNRRLTEEQPSVTDATTGTVSRPTRTTVYDDVGNVLTVEDARGNVTGTEYDAARRPLEVTAPLVTKPDGTTAHPVTVMTYDKAGNVLTVTDANGHVTTNTYDELGRLKTTLQKPDADPDHDILVANAYDAAGNRTAVFDGKNQRTDFTYDGLNRNTSIKDPAGRKVSYTYNAINKTDRFDAEGRRTTYRYDQRHRLLKTLYVYRDADSLTYDYDLAGRLLSVTKPNAADVAGTACAYTYDALGRQLTETSGGKQHTYAYDLVGNRVTVTYGGTGTVLTSTYDVLNRLLTLSELPTSGAPSSARLTTYGYDLNGNRVFQSLPNGEETDTTFDALNRQTGIVTTKSGGGTLLALVQAYDLVGNVARITESYPGSTLSGRTVTNTYDNVNRLTDEVTVEGAKTTATTYGFDRANNRTAKAVATTTGSGTTVVDTAYVYNNLNQLQTATTGTAVTSFSYDLNGNRETRTKGGFTDTYTYDYENRLVSLAQETSSSTSTFNYQYDYRTRRVERTENATTTKLVFSGGVSVAEYEGGTPSVPSVEYIRGSDWGGGVGGLLYSVRSGAPSFKHYNSRGDVISETNDAGASTWQGTYEAYGTRTQEVGTTQDRQKANTKEEDPTGLLNEGFRYRDLETGVFITRDPLGFVDGPNMYAYVVQNPWSKFDPEGLTPDEDAAKKKQQEAEKQKEEAANADKKAGPKPNETAKDNSNKNSAPSSQGMDGGPVKMDSLTGKPVGGGETQTGPNLNLVGKNSGDEKINYPGGTYVIAAHGKQRYLINPETNRPITAKELAVMLKNNKALNYKDGTSLYIAACDVGSTGLGSSNFIKDLAKYMKVPVTGPSTILWIEPSTGKSYVMDPVKGDDGKPLLNDRGKMQPDWNSPGHWVTSGR